MAKRPTYEELEQRVKELEGQADAFKRAHDELRKSEQEKDAILNSILEVVLYQDLEHRMLWGNRMASGSVYLPPEKLVGRYCYEVWQQRSEPCPGCPVVKTRETGQTQEAQITTPDGRVWFVRGYPVLDANGDIGGVVEVKLEITDQKRTKEALRDSEGRYRTQFDLSPQAMAMTDVNTGRLIEVNDKFCEVTKYSREELIGRTTTECQFYSKGDRDRFIKKLKGSGEIHGLEMDFRTKDGSILNTLMFSKLIPISGKTFILSIFLDLTGQKRLELQLQRARKMEAIGTLAGGIAHNFNNVLTGIQWSASLMLCDMDYTNPHHEMLVNIQKQVESGAKLTGQLLGYARKGRYDVKPVDLNQLVEDTSDMFRRTRKEITIHRDLAEDLCGIEADEGQIEQVLLNMCVNAADAMPGGGDLTLRTMNVTHKDMQGNLYDPKPGTYVVLKVTDTGSGMDKETLERVFDPFFTTKEMGRGTGLGLASTYGIIKGHGGYIDVDSERGRGTTFSIYLPSSDKQVQKTVKTAGQIIEGRGTILLVDDEAMILNMGLKMLERLGYTVLGAKEGEEAVQIYRAKKDTIDLVILDMIMPKMGGGEAYDRMK
ncbi:MAG TPA: PAS domain-containing sensor histidine kinase, partial [Desulfobacterales bacterium]|nr:PAS domain-containing sensor histidine kinase [Desulfobacterales bacterium]